MKALLGKRQSVSILDSHHFICVLIDADFPLLSLHSDGRLDWLHLWCDTDNLYRNRWILFPSSREQLISYLKKSTTLLELLTDAKSHYVLEEARHAQSQTRDRTTERSVSRYLQQVSLDQLTEYLPSSDSLFDDELTGDVDVTEQIQPTTYCVPISGAFFGLDFKDLFKRYEQIYAFFYATGPRFIRTLNSRLEELLRSPWQGGFSRVNLFTGLPQSIPAVHALRVRKLDYASPGEIRFEAVESVGKSVERSTLAFLKNQSLIDSNLSRIGKTLSGAGLNKLDLSSVGNDRVPLEKEKLICLHTDCKELGQLVQAEKEFAVLDEHAPNTVVYAKAAVSFAHYLSFLATFQTQELLDFGRAKPIHHSSSEADLPPD